MTAPRPPACRSSMCLSIMLLATGLCAGSGVAHAHDGGENSRAALPRAHLSEIQGQYTLADGRTLTIGGSAYRIRAQLDGRPESVVAPVGGAVFRALDGSFSLHFEQHANGIVTGVTLVEAPDAGAASRTAPATGAR